MISSPFSPSSSTSMIHPPTDDDDWRTTRRRTKQSSSRPPRRYCRRSPFSATPTLSSPISSKMFSFYLFGHHRQNWNPIQHDRRQPQPFFLLARKHHHQELCSSSSSSSSSWNITTSSAELFLDHFCLLAKEHIHNAYRMDHPIRWSVTSNCLSTTLPATIISLIKSQISILEGSLLGVIVGGAGGIVDCPSTTNTTYPTSSSSSSPTHNCSNSSYILNRPMNLFVQGVQFLLECLLEQHQCHYQSFLLRLRNNTNNNHNSTGSSSSVTTYQYNIMINEICAMVNDMYHISQEMELYLQGELMDRIVQQGKIIHHPNDDTHTHNQHPCYHCSYEYEQELSLLWNETVVHPIFQGAVSMVQLQLPLLIIQYIRTNTSIPLDLFSLGWEIDYTHNEVIQTFIQRIDQLFFIPIQNNLRKDDDNIINNNNNNIPYDRNNYNTFLFGKVLIATTQAMVSFYIRCLIEQPTKSIVYDYHYWIPHSISHHGDRSNTNRMKSFSIPTRALIRMRDDIVIMENFFINKANGNSTLIRRIRQELFLLKVIHEFLDTVVHHRDVHDALDTFMIVIHKQIGTPSWYVTRRFVLDLYDLVNIEENDDSWIEPQHDLMNHTNGVSLMKRKSIIMAKCRNPILTKELQRITAMMQMKKEYSQHPTTTSTITTTTTIIRKNPFRPQHSSFSYSSSSACDDINSYIHVKQMLIKFYKKDCMPIYFRR